MISEKGFSMGIKLLVCFLFLIRVQFMFGIDSNDALTLQKIKQSFHDRDDALFDWDSSHYCHSMGVTCDNLTFSIIQVNLSGLNLGGKLSPAFAELRSLQSLDLTQNNLSGEIPEVIYQNMALEYLSLQDNSLTGVLSPYLCQSNLYYFDVGNNSLTGSIPLNIGNSTTLRNFDLSYNHLTGEIPSSIGFSLITYMDLQNNQLTGRIPFTIGFMPKLASLNLSCNFISESIPPNLGNLTKLISMNLQSNMLTGSIPPELGNMSKLKYLKLDNNIFIGRIPAEFGKLTSLSILLAHNNNLEGPIPDELSSCTPLHIINLSGNKLNGTIPPGLGKLHFLTYLNLSSNNIEGPIPVELSLYQNLNNLDLSSNRINGSLPSDLGDLELLLVLNLSNNALVGSIPAEVGKLKSIVDIDLSLNQLSGPIPMEFSYQQNLVSLNLSKNALVGCIPPRLGTLISVTDIDLSHNQLSGSIPVEFSHLITLLSLNMSYNNLTGDIPMDLSRFSLNSFVGNPGLSISWNNTPSHRSHSSKQAILRLSFEILGVVLIVDLLILAGFYFWKKLTRQQPTPNFPKLEIVNDTVSHLTYEKLMRKTQNFSDKYEIGRGASCIVYKCKIKNCKHLAIKKLTQNCDQQLFLTELDIVRRLNDPNVVQLQAYALDPSGNILVYDLMENGCLRDFLIDEQKMKQMNWEIRLKIAFGAASGLRYLHEMHTINRDIKSANILLDKNLNAYISDFGFARMVSGSHSVSSLHCLGTPGYTDLAYHATLRVSTRLDVYSYGMVLIELLTGKDILDSEGLGTRICELPVNARYNIMNLVDQRISYSDVDYQNARAVLDLARECINPMSRERPTMAEVTNRLRSLLHPENEE